MERNRLLLLTLPELCEADILGVLGNLIVTGNWVQHMQEIIAGGVQEPDVYINNYFEIIVPQYSNETYRSHFRMTRNTMVALTEEVRNVFVINNVNVDKMIIPLEKKMHVTLWMLANYAVTFRECGTLFGLSTGNVHYIFLEICTALCMLRHQYIKWPSINQCEITAEEIMERSSFPGVIGAIDGCHIEIKAPPGNPYDYYNRKQFHSVILQGTCDPSLKFIDTFVGVPGRAHDARVFRLSPLRVHIERSLIPADMHILADSAYGLHENVLTPYRDNGHLTGLQKRYNTRHSAVRSCIERAFGLLKNKFRRLRFLDMDLVEEIPNVISACCVLHNFIILNEGYAEDDIFLDDVDDVPALLDDHPLQFRNGVNKRDHIAAHL